MTRKHFQRLAYALSLTRPSDVTRADGTPASRYGAKDSETHRAAMSAWVATRDGIADVCAASNSNFDRARFNAATEAAGYVPAMHGR